MYYNPYYYLHNSDKAALKALKAIPGFSQLLKGFMKVWSERQFKVINLSNSIRINENQLSEYYNMLPPICDKLGIEIPELYLQLDVFPNSYTAGETKPFIVITSGLLETLPEELIPTVLAHECGHIACHHVLYSTMGRMILNGTFAAIQNYSFGIGGLITFPLEVAFYYWMRCSEFSADRAAVLCDETAEKMSDICMRLAGFDKDIKHIPNKNEFLLQAEEYRKMVKNSKWDKTIEFWCTKNMDHPLLAVRALECIDWSKTNDFTNILNGNQELIKPQTEKKTNIENDDKNKKKQFKFKELLNKPKELIERKDIESTAEEIRAYKQLWDDGIITEKEFNEKKKQLLNL